MNDVLKIETTGNGLGLLQVHTFVGLTLLFFAYFYPLKVHVEYNTPATNREDCAFDFNVSAEVVDPAEAYGQEKEAVVDVCVRWIS